MNKTDDTARGRGESCNKVCSRFNDPKLELEYVGGGMTRGVMAEGDDRVSKADDVAGGRGEKIAVVCGSWESLDNVSTNEYLSNLCGVMMMVSRDKSTRRTVLALQKVIMMD